jgi:hypothetical protein
MKSENTQNAITRFIDQVAEVLPAEPEKLIRMEVAPMRGSDLKLTGIRDFKGKPIQDLEIYQIDVPVYEGTWIQGHVDPVNIGQYAVPKYVDHRRELRLSYLKHGLQGIYSYLGKYMAEKEVDKVRKTFMRINGKVKASI